MKMFQFHMFFTCEMSCEIFERVVPLDVYSWRPACEEQVPKFKIKEIRAV